MPANSELAALEVTPGVLLRVTTATGDKLFSQAAMALDPVGTAGHLVSMAVADGVVNVSTALLANHMESALAAGVANAGSGPAPRSALFASLPSPPTRLFSNHQRDHYMRLIHSFIRKRELFPLFSHN